ncbi:MAG: hypothetical protein FJZ56_06600 [Chlamydiae bacterium]|nr:hypothetical protein [Chlamydiota bacterium]
MNETRNMGQRHNFIGMEGPFLGVEEDPDSEMLKPVFQKYSQNQDDFLTVTTDPNLATTCISLLAINYLNMAHNNCVEQDDRCSKGLKIFAIEIGLFAATFLLAPIEIITRLAIGIILTIPMAIAYFTSDKADSEAFASDKADSEAFASDKADSEAFDCMNSLSFVGALATCFALANGAISTYTNLAYSNRKIDYEGQFRKFFDN